jgi:hypothetical protein
MERIFSFFLFTYDGIEFKKINEKKPKVKIGPVKEHVFFYLMILDHYVNWLKEHELILNEEYVKEHYFLSDPFKKSIAEKIMIKAIVVPTSYDLSSFSMESEKAVLKYPKDAYKPYIKDDEKLYLIHRQLTVPSMIRNKLILLVICFGLFSLLSTLVFIYLQQGIPDEMHLIIFPVVPLFFIVYYLFKTLMLLKRTKNVEAIFTELKVIFKRKEWTYPLSYDDIASIERANEKSKKGYIRQLHFHAKQRANVMTLYDVRLMILCLRV